MKQCTKCFTFKELNDFNNTSKSKDGKTNWCKICKKEYNDKRYKNNKEKIKLTTQIWYQNNKEKHKTHTYNYQLTNPEKKKQYQNKWKNKNKEYFKKWRYEKYHNDPNFKLRIILGNRLNEILRKNNTYKNSNITQLLGCSLEELKKHLEKQFNSSMSWDNHGIFWEVDHIKPCAAFDLTNLEEQKQCFHYTNLQPLSKSNNRKKSKKII